MAALEVFQRADVAEHPVLGVLTHGAGVEKNEVGFFRILRKFIARDLEHALDPLAVGYVLLTAVGADIRERYVAALADAHQFRGQVQIFDLSVRHIHGFRQTTILPSYNKPIIRNIISQDIRLFKRFHAIFCDSLSGLDRRGS